VVDCLSATIDYTHENASAVLSSLHRALTAIGHHALNTSSGAEIDTKLATFEERGLDSQYLLKLPPKQTLHVLRLAVLQTIVKERRYEEGCLVSMTDEDFAVLRGDLNDYCGGASSTGTTSSKLPFCYFQIGKRRRECLTENKCLTFTFMRQSLVSVIFLCCYLSKLGRESVIFLLHRKFKHYCSARLVPTFSFSWSTNTRCFGILICGFLLLFPNDHALLSVWYTRMLSFCESNLAKWTGLG
jgi:hypothetical protein